MARTLIVQLTCDRCKSEKDEVVEGTETVSFGYDDYSYSLDLCGPHAEDFHGTIQALISSASDRSRIGGASRTRALAADGSTSPDLSGPRRSAGDRDRLKAIRDWARKNGHPDLGDRGRIPQGIVAEYDAAH